MIVKEVGSRMIHRQGNAITLYQNQYTSNAILSTNSLTFLKLGACINMFTAHMTFAKMEFYNMNLDKGGKPQVCPHCFLQWCSGSNRVCPIVIEHLFT